MANLDFRTATARSVPSILAVGLGWGYPPDMAEIRPFQAIRYDYRPLMGDLSTRIAPPYDVLDQSDKDALLARNNRNIVAVDLPHVPPKSLGPPEAYDQAGATFREWLTDGTLVREAQPALYVYHQIFEHAGRTYVRRKFFARVRLVPFSDGVVLPHEETFGGPKEDRLALMKATAANLSPVFALYADPEGTIDNAFAPHVGRPPNFFGTLDGVESRVWIVTEAETLMRVALMMADKQVFIADGHHRYGTALNYREQLKAQGDGRIDPDHPANFVLMVLGSMNDPGSLILPYYRVLAGPGMSLDALREAWAGGVTECAESEADLMLCDGASGKRQPLHYSNRDALCTLAPEKSPAWRRLDYAYLHRYLIDELLSRKLGDAVHVHYVKSPEQVHAVAKSEGGVGLMVKATPMAHLRAVSEAGDLMPQKSTYFYPKLATGLVINPLQ